MAARTKRRPPRWSLPTLGGWCLLALAACATAEAPAGAGGDGGSVGGAGGATATTGAAHSASTGVDPWQCGNGVIDTGESCDGTDLDGKDCTSFGLGEGTLACNDHCTFYLADCAKVEICGDGLDTDFDGKIDCEDEDCAGAATCVDSCTPAKVLGLPDTITGTTRGRPAVHKASCSATSGNEAMYQLTSLTTGKLILNLESSDVFTYSLSVRTTCGDDASEIACSTDWKKHALAIEVVAGTTYFVMVDSLASTPGNFKLHVEPWHPESACVNLIDDDDDGHVDCDDATGCQGTVDCDPGGGLAGEPCSVALECAANQGDPVCLPLKKGFPGGYCSEFCDLAAPDCAGDGVCVQLGISASGVCLDGCVSDADCRAEYRCADAGNAQKACLAAPETSCNDNLDNDGNGTIDCGDPGCQALPACAPGTTKAGAPCTLNADCFAGSNDPLCISEGTFSWPGGYCSELCTLGADDCPAGSACVNWFQLGSGQGTCMQTCDVMADCRMSYACFDLSGPTKYCVY